MNKTLISISTTLLLFPIITLAQDDLQTLLPTFGNFINTVLVPFILGIAFLAFVYNVVRFFILGRASGEGSDDDRAKAKALVLYSVMAFVLIIVFAGIVNLIVSGIGGEGTPPPESDYLQQNGGGFNGGAGGAGGGGNGGFIGDDPCETNPFAPGCDFNNAA